MRIEGPAFDLALNAGALLRLEGPGNVEVRCESGRVWITEESRREDIWLRPGQSTHLEGNGLALVEATGPARIHLK